MEYNKEYEYYTQRNGHRRGGDPNCDTAEQDSEQCRYTCAKAGVLLIVGSGNFSYSEEIEKQEMVVAEFDEKIDAAAADYQELTRLLAEKEEAEMVLLDLMEQWEAAQEG